MDCIAYLLPLSYAEMQKKKGEKGEKMSINWSQNLDHIYLIYVDCLADFIH